MEKINLNAQQEALHRAGVELPYRSDAVTALEAVAEKPRFQPAMVTHPQMAIPFRRSPPIMAQKPMQVPLPKNGLPPWGKMEERLAMGLDPAVIPIDWTPKDWRVADDDAGEREPHFDQKEWQEWFDDVVTRIDSLIWPTFDPDDPSKWNKESIAKLFDADFAILDAIHQNLELPIIGERIRAADPALSETIKFQKMFSRAATS